MEIMGLGETTTCQASVGPGGPANKQLISVCKCVNVTFVKTPLIFLLYTVHLIEHVLQYVDIDTLTNG